MCQWSAVPVAPQLVYERCEGDRGTGPEGADDLCWAKIWSETGIWATWLEWSYEAGVELPGLYWILMAKLRSQPGGWKRSLEAGIGANTLGLGRLHWDWCLKAGIRALRLVLGPQGQDCLGLEAAWPRGRGTEEEKIFPVWESIGHRPLRRCYPKKGGYQKRLTFIHSLLYTPVKMWYQFMIRAGGERCRTKIRLKR